MLHTARHSKRKKTGMLTTRIFASNRPILNTSLGAMARRAYANASALVMTRAGEPLDVLALQEMQVEAAGPGQILVQVLAAPINPSDINTVQGVYPKKPKYNNVPGHEGVAKVLSAGDGSGMLPGDLVVPLSPGQGTWRTSGVFNAVDWHKIPAGVPIDAAATMRVNPCSALGMLEDFVQLSPGDVVVQNGANSSVGELVIQMAKRRGIRTVNIVRDRPDLEELSMHLRSLGADIVATPATVRQVCKDGHIPPAKLALDCVGGETASLAAKMLQHGGTMVTYGAMSKQAAMIPAPLLIFKDIRVRGFWMSGGAHGEDPDSARQALNRVAEMIEAGVLVQESRAVHLSDWQTAFIQIAEGTQRQCKYLLKMV